MEQLSKVLKAAFPKDEFPVKGSDVYYYSSDVGKWAAFRETRLPSHPISDFYTEDKPEFVRGEVVEVREYNVEKWVDRIYLTTIEGAIKPYMCVAKSHEYLFKTNDPFDITHWTQIRKLQPKHIEVTRDEIATWKGCKPEQIVIV